MGLAECFKERRGVVATLLLVAALGGCGSGSDDNPPPGDSDGGGVGLDTLPTIDVSTSVPAELTKLVVSGSEIQVSMDALPVATFVVRDESGKGLKGLTTNNVQFTLAKLVPESDHNPSRWQSYINIEREKTNDGVTRKVIRANTEKNGTLEYHGNGKYTYTFATDIQNVTMPLAVAYEPDLTHRLGIQISGSIGGDPLPTANQTHTWRPDGQSVALTRDIVNTESCNQCHGDLAPHGGGRKEVKYCVTCHNPGTRDAWTGDTVDFQYFIHKLHRGRNLPSVVAGGRYVVNSDTHDYSNVGFPQDLRNCTKCHDNTKAADADNWKSKPTQQACGSCHDDVDFSNHRSFNWLNADGTPNNKECTTCHVTGDPSVTNPYAVENVHWIQAEANAAKYRFDIEGVTLNGDRTVTIDYAIVDPTDGDAPYDVKESRYSGVRLYVATNTTPGVNGDDYSSTLNVTVSNGIETGEGRYRITTGTLPEAAKGTARIASLGQVRESRLDVATRLPIEGETINVPLRNSVYDLDLSTGEAGTARRQIVATEKCESCHGTLGVTFHGGARNSTEVCAICHDANRLSSGTLADGTQIKESLQFKRMIHGIHSGVMRENPFVNKSGKDYTAEVHYPGILSDCNSCHVNESYRTDRGVFATSIDFGPDDTRGTADDLRISPKAATCSSCHDRTALRIHMSDMGAVFDQTQEVISTVVYERCDECHGNGGPKDVKVVHKAK